MALVRGLEWLNMTLDAPGGAWNGGPEPET